MRDIEPENSWKAKLAALFIAWPFVVIFLAMNIPTFTFQLKHWIILAIVCMISILWILELIRLIRSLRSH